MLAQGDTVYFIKSWNEIYPQKYGKSRYKTRMPIELKILSIKETEDGTKYIVEGGHFFENWIGKIVFFDWSSARNELRRLEEELEM